MIAAVIGIGLYVLLAGASAAVLRAAQFEWLTLFARQTGRRQVGSNSLTSTTTSLQALVNPLTLWDAGLQLFLTATLGLVLHAGPFSDTINTWISRRLPAWTATRLTKPAGEYLLTTLAVIRFGQPAFVLLPSSQTEDPTASIIEPIEAIVLEVSTTEEMGFFVVAVKECNLPVLVKWMGHPENIVLSSGE